MRKENNAYCLSSAYFIYSAVNGLDSTMRASELMLVDIFLNALTNMSPGLIELA